VSISDDVTGMMRWSLLLRLARGPLQLPRQHRRALPSGGVIENKHPEPCECSYRRAEEQELIHRRSRACSQYPPCPVSRCRCSSPACREPAPPRGSTACCASNVSWCRATATGCQDVAAASLTAPAPRRSSSPAQGRYQ